MFAFHWWMLIPTLWTLASAMSFYKVYSENKDQGTIVFFGAVWAVPMVMMFLVRFLP